MTVSLLSTKLYVPPARLNGVPRPHLIERLNTGLGCRLTLISAPAGFGKSTLVSEWLSGCQRPVAWLSLDDGDNDLTHFLAYLVAAVQTVAADIGGAVLAALQAPQPPPAESLLTSLLNDIAARPGSFILVLDDCHVIDSQPVDQALAFLVEHLPPHLHLVIATREDPRLPLARLRVRGQLAELRAADLRFTPAEAADFLNRVMGLSLSAEHISALEARTEGWIAGLQLAAISMQGHKDAAGFIKSFTGSHRFVLDYLVEEVLQQQPESIQAFLLVTSILDRMCGSLCDAVLCNPSVPGQQTLERIEQANLFIVPLDNERNWYRYHHLFAELLRQRLVQSLASPTGNAGQNVAKYHVRASQWYEEQGLELEAFQHAVAANDVERAERLMEGKGIPLHLRGAATAIRNWLESLPAALLDARPLLRVRSATLSLAAGQTTGIEEQLLAAEDAIAASRQGAGPVQNEINVTDDKTRDLIGQIAAARATVASARYQTDTMIDQARRALEYLPADNLYSRFRANWTLARAYHYRGERAAASRVYSEALSIAQLSGDIHNTSLAMTCLGQIQELENQLRPAVETYRQALQLLGGDYLPPYASAAYLGLAHICYEWNDLDAAEQHGQRSLQLARQYDRMIDRFVMSEVFLARIKLARGDAAGAGAMLAETSRSVQQHSYVHRIPEVAAQQVMVLLQQGDLAAAAHLAQTQDLPLTQARVHLAQGDPSAALALLAPLRQQLQAKGWADESLKAMALQAVALYLSGEEDDALQVLDESLGLAEPGGFIRLFVDEGAPMARLLSEARMCGVMPDYVGRLLAAFASETPPGEDTTVASSALLTERELEVLLLIAQGLSNQAICERLCLALDTVKGHNRRIYGKLQAQSRTEAIARARELGLL